VPSNAATSFFVLGLGANLGDRLQNLRAAADAFDLVIARSGVYETPPAGGPPQPDYLNAAISLRTTLGPRALLDRALAVERQLGRRRPDPIRWGPRTIDIDVLWWQQGSHHDERLDIPHPRLTDRAFALVPLLELAPDACDPLSGARYADLATARSSIRRIADL